MIAAVIPFLMFFMLIRKDHIYEWLCTTFATVTDVPKFVGRVTRMVRGFSGGNLIIGSVMAAVMPSCPIAHLQPTGRTATHGTALGPSQRRDGNASDSIFAKSISIRSKEVTESLYLFVSMFDFPSS